MDYAIIGFGAVGKAIARQFAAKSLEVSVATRRPPEQVSGEAAAIGNAIKPTTLQEAVEADVVILAIPYAEHHAVGAALASWSGKTVIDATNAFGIPLAQFDGLTASAVAADNYPGAHFAKAFNHLPAKKLAADPAVNGGRRVIFVSSDDEASLTSAEDLVELLGYAPVSLGTLAESGPLVSAREDHWSPLNFQDLVKIADK